jgi:hypothetical protein
MVTLRKFANCMPMFLTQTWLCRLFTLLLTARPISVFVFPFRPALTPLPDTFPLSYILFFHTALFTRDIFLTKFFGDLFPPMIQMCFAKVPLMNTLLQDNTLFTRADNLLPTNDTKTQQPRQISEYANGVTLCRIVSPHTAVFSYVRSKITQTLSIFI